MPKTEEQKRDAYYRKKYGVGLDWYDARFKEQGGCCGICRRPQEQFTKRFAIDHDHGWKKSRVITDKLGKEWMAEAMYVGTLFRADRQSRKPDAIRKVKEKLKFRSCRGLLCPFCNRGLRFYADDPNRLANAAEYLKRHQNAR